MTTPRIGTPTRAGKKLVQRHLVLAACVMTSLFILLSSTNTIRGPGSVRLLQTWQFANSTHQTSTTFVSTKSLANLFTKTSKWLLVGEATLSEDVRFIREHGEIEELSRAMLSRQRLDNDNDAVLQRLNARQLSKPAGELPWEHYWDARRDVEDDYEPTELDIDNKPPKLRFMDIVRTCTSLACLRRAHQIPRRRGQHSFPHALLVGWQDPAFRELHDHLEANPVVVKSKATEFFSTVCKAEPMFGCPLDKQRQYIETTLKLKEYVASAGVAMVFEESPSYAMNGDILAPALRRTLPWVKVVIGLREPISRAAGMVLHKAKSMNNACLKKSGNTLFSCVDAELRGHARGSSSKYQYVTSPYGNYSAPLRYWVESFPSKQLLVLQYEQFKTPTKEARLLRSMKRFLGIDETLPSSSLVHSEGQVAEDAVLTKAEYLQLIEYVRPDVTQVAALVAKYKLGVAQQWITTWEQVWQSNLGKCSKDGKRCVISLR